MVRKITFRWNLRQLMAAHELARASHSSSTMRARSGR